jgi:hypothetical protein
VLGEALTMAVRGEDGLVLACGDFDAAVSVKEDGLVFASSINEEEFLSAGSCAHESSFVPSFGKIGSTSKIVQRTEY